MNTLASNMKELQSAITEYNKIHDTTYTAGIGAKRGYEFFDANSFKRINSTSWSIKVIYADTKDKLLVKLPNLKSLVKVRIHQS